MKEVKWIENGIHVVNLSGKGGTELGVDGVRLPSFDLYQSLFCIGWTSPPPPPSRLLVMTDTTPLIVCVYSFIFACHHRILELDQIQILEPPL